MQYCGFHLYKRVTSLEGGSARLLREARTSNYSKCSSVVAPMRGCGVLQPPCRGGLAPLSGKIIDLSGKSWKTFERRLTTQTVFFAWYYVSELFTFFSINFFTTALHIQDHFCSNQMVNIALWLFRQFAKFRLTYQKFQILGCHSDMRMHWYHNMQTKCSDNSK